MKALVNRTRVLVARRPDSWIAAALGVLAFGLYARTMPPTVLAGDGGEFQHMAYYLGVPHSSGYPLYILLAKLFTFLPFHDVAFRVNLFSVVSAALAVPFIYAIALRLIGRRAPAALAKLIFTVTPSMWGGALEPKTYALHLLLGVLSIFFALRWHQENSSRDPSATLRTSFYALALTFGLGLTNHHIIVFLAPALAFVVWLNRARLNRTMVARGAALMLLPLLLYAYIPIRASQLIAQQTPENWQLYTREDAILKGTISSYYRNSIDGFLNLITGFDNFYKIKSPLDDLLNLMSGLLRSNKANAPAADDNRIALVAKLLFDQFGVVGLALSALGAFVSLRRDRKLFGFVFLIALGIGAIATVLRGISAVYYFSLAYLALALWIGFGIDGLMKRSLRLHRVLPIALAIVLLALPMSALVLNFSRLDESSDCMARDYAKAILHDALAPNAVVIAPWEVSEPLRYFQFVENQRADLLVVNESPVRKQFWTMYTNARALKRPFYYVEFNPELATPGKVRTIQAVPLPMPTEPAPRFALNDARIVPQVQVVGYDLDPNPPIPGKPARVLIYYRALAPIYPMYSAMLTLSDITGKIWSKTESFPTTFYFETFRWQTGDAYRQTWTIDLPADAPPGFYKLGLSWFVYDLNTQKTDYDHEASLALGALRVGDAGAQIEHPQSTRVGAAISFLGWNTNAGSVARGDSLRLDLFWRADQPIAEAYTVFAHLIDASGRVVADADSPPSSGLFPTDRWIVGESLRDRHVLKIPADLAPGNYAIEIGMYLAATGARLPIDQTDRLVLTQVSVR